MERLFFQKKIRILLYVVSIHVLIVFVLSLQNFFYGFTPTVSQIHVREFRIEEEKPAPVPQKIYVRKTKPKAAAQTAPKPKRSNYQDHILSKIERDLGKIATNTRKKADLSVPKKIDQLSIDTKIELSHHDTNHFYQSRLIEEMQNHLHLPEYGEVCMELSMNKNGQIKNIKVLNSKSKKNETYLQNAILEMTFPWMREFFSEKNVMQFTITFRNQD